MGGSEDWVARLSILRLPDVPCCTVALVAEEEFSFVFGGEGSHYRVIKAGAYLG